VRESQREITAPCAAGGHTAGRRLGGGSRCVVVGNELNSVLQVSPEVRRAEVECVGVRVVRDVY
jgi:hypothetical protein